ncbi:eukaryotic translation initiation factor 4G-like [Dorcoceras hygrometricum]|uniref:Eukaryotic translation initiation factor 4G-like n=1 Tax=Dorcoceras hygrometricum TaxID=472368 RepID=A0A2Z7AT77_9LAMI|nr:eukaryotic translation initiation factor 4G-like [Dorcoceras hygrometricum]
MSLAHKPVTTTSRYNQPLQPFATTSRYNQPLQPAATTSCYWFYGTNATVEYQNEMYLLNFERRRNC